MFSLFQHLSFLASFLSGGPSSHLAERVLVPRVGDSVVLSGTLWKGLLARSASSSISNVDYDSATNRMLVESVLSVSGEEPTIENEWLDASEMIDEEIAPYLAQLMCENEDIEGEFVELETPVGTFVSCKIRIDEDTSEGYMWVGAVPFGVLKADIKDTAQNLRYQGVVSQYSWK